MSSTTETVTVKESAPETIKKTVHIEGSGDKVILYFPKSGTKFSRSYPDASPSNGLNSLVRILYTSTVTEPRGMAYYLLDKLEDNKYLAVGSSRSCREVLQEETKLHYGLHRFKDYCYLGIASIDKFSKEAWLNNDNLIGILNRFEEYLHIPTRTTMQIITHASDETSIIPCDNVLALTVPKVWFESTPMQSLYALIIRAAMYYKSKSTFDDHIKWFAKLNHAYGSDTSYIIAAVPKIEVIRKLGIDTTLMTSLNYTHRSYGIHNFDAAKYVSDMDFKKLAAKK